MPYTPIVATLGYVLSPDRSEVLMIHRNARPDDLHLGKYNGLGGKMEAGEDIAACMQREILEEAGIVCESMRLRGTLNWPGFGKHGEDWLGFIFVIDGYRGEPHRGRWRKISEFIAAFVMTALVAAAALALQARVAESGWTATRIYAAAAMTMLGLHALGYVCAALIGLGGGRWMHRIEAVNIALSLLVAAACLALSSPLADPLRLAVRAQSARLDRGADPNLDSYLYN